MSVAMVMPETGLAEEPMRPTMRELTVTKRNPKTTTSSDAARLGGPADKCAGDGLELKKEEHEDDDERASRRATTRMERSSSVRMGLALRRAAPARMVFEARR